MEEHSGIEAGKNKHCIFGEWNEIRLESYIAVWVKDYSEELGALDSLRKGIISRFVVFISPPLLLSLPRTPSLECFLFLSI